jgi:hypothetical protein
MRSKLIHLISSAVIFAAPFLWIGCGGSGADSSNTASGTQTPAVQTGTVSVMVSDGSPRIVSSAASRCMRA